MVVRADRADPMQHPYGRFMAQSFRQLPLERALGSKGPLTPMEHGGQEGLGRPGPSRQGLRPCRAR